MVARMKKALAFLLCAMMLTGSMSFTVALAEEEKPTCGHIGEFQWYDEEVIELGITAHAPNGHTSAWRTVTTWLCLTCNQPTWKTSEDSFVLEAHIWNIKDGQTCVICGERNPCAHPDAHTEKTRGYLPDGFTYVDKTYHRATVEIETFTACDDCGATWGLAKTTDTELVYHSYGEDPLFCNECEHANTCTHQWKLLNDPEDVDEYEPLNAASHSHTHYQTAEAECSVCHVFGVINTYAEKTTENHDWNDQSVCDDCGYACKHEKAVTDSYIQYGGAIFTPVDLDGHSTHAVKVTTMDCGVCGFHSVTEEEGDFFEAHEWNLRGECSRCGYACEAHVYSKEDQRCVYCGVSCSHKDLVVTHPIYKIEYTYYDNGHHTVVEYNNSFAECPDCGYSDLDEATGTYGYNELHSFVDGVCACGMEEPDCDHSIVEQSAFSGDYTDNGDGTHDAVGSRTTVRICEDCGLIFEEKTAPETITGEEHWYNYDRLCICGAEAPDPCNHRGPYSSVDHEEDEYEDLGDGTHRHIHRVGEKRTCYLCGEAQFIVASETETVENHTFDENGPCNACGYDNGCDHKSAVRVWLYDSYEQVVSHGDTHSGWRVSHYEYQCPDCPAAWPYEIFRKIDDEPHSFVDDVCEVCGVLANCDHDYQLSGDPTVEEECVVSDPATTHTVVKTEVSVYVCAICGDTCTERKELESVTEAHRFGEYNMCLDCRYVCYHTEGFAELETYEDTDPLPFDRDSHSHTHTTFTSSACVTCGYVESERQTDSERIMKAHEYDKDGVCTVCGFACLHEEEDVEVLRTVASDPVVESLGHKGHRITVEQVNEVRCKHCGAEFTVAIDPEVTEAAHDLTLGERTTCADCDYACEHPAMAPSGEPRITTSYEKKSAAAHTVTTVKSYEAACPDCGYRTEVTETPVTAEEAHDWASGACAKCGYVCEHPNAERAGVPIFDDVYVPIDEENHEFTTTERYAMSCPECGESFTHYEPTTEPVIQPHEWNDEHVCELCEQVCQHRWADGLCKICGAVCDHDYVERVNDPTATYDEKDADSHIVHVTESSVFTCSVCGDSYETSQTTDRTEAHVWGKDGVCALCGYVCEHPGARQSGESKLDVRYVSAGSREHTRIEAEYHDMLCPVCELTFTVYAEEDVRVTEDHRWSDGVCADCGHECEHDFEIDGHTEEPGVYAVKDALTHTVTVKGAYDEHCVICGYVFRSEYTTATAEEHVWKTPDDPDVCDKCGYVYGTPLEPTPTPSPVPTPSATPTTMPTAEPTLVPPMTVAPTATPTAEPAGEPEIVFVDVPVTEEMHGVAAQSHERMGVALVTAAQAIEAEYGETVEVTVVHAERVLTAVEHQSLQQLPTFERVLVMLEVLGYEGEVSNALREMDVTLSPEAQALVEEILARIAALSEEDYEALMALIAELFPVQGEQMYLMLSIGGRLERYAFTEQDGVWVFVQMAVAQSV